MNFVHAAFFLRLSGGMLIYVKAAFNVFHVGSSDGRILALNVGSTDTI
jgi:hypothetical protein